MTRSSRWMTASSCWVRSRPQRAQSAGLSYRHPKMQVPDGGVRVGVAADAVVGARVRVGVAVFICAFPVGIGVNAAMLVGETFGFVLDSPVLPIGLASVRAGLLVARTRTVGSAGTAPVPVLCSPSTCCSSSARSDPNSATPCPPTSRIVAQLHMESVTHSSKMSADIRRYVLRVACSRASLDGGAGVRGLSRWRL
jgi:hypothetical protein